MFDFHMHSSVSFDSSWPAQQMAQAAVERGLKEICFTDHMDHDFMPGKGMMTFDIDQYNAAYDSLQVEGLTIRKGMEYGLKTYNQEQFRKDLQLRRFDFVLGSVHFVDELDVYVEEYWEGKTVQAAYLAFMEQTIACVKAHTEFDVLAHLTFIAKARGNVAKTPIFYEDYRQMADEILKELVSKGKGLELNTSGVDKCGDFLPGEGFFRRFRELGGEIVTVGSDAHNTVRVGQYTDRACDMLREIFGYVCTFADRKPVFHKL